MKGTIIVLMLAAVFTAGCDDDAIETVNAPTYAEVAPIIERACLGCHVEGGIAPFALSTYEQARSMSQRIAAATSDGSMPPWSAIDSADCRPRRGWKNDIRLSASEIDVLARWDAAGAPEGVGATITAPKYELQDVELELEPAEPYVTSGMKDEFRCFVMDPGFTDTMHVNGAFIVPGNREVVHHAAVVADPTRASAALVGASGNYDCFAGFDVPDAVPLAVWTPGQDPVERPDNVGTPVSAGSLLVMQIHYHPVGPAADPDLTHVQLRFSENAPEFVLLPAHPIGNFETAEDGLITGPEFEIPANAPDHVEAMQFTVPSTTKDGEPLPEVWLYGAAAHMHYIGVDATIEIEHAGGDRECLLHDRWDFDWQRMYSYDAPIEELPKVGAGDTIRVTCRYDNTMNNPGVVRALHDRGLTAPIDVHLGEETTDEMCLALLPVLLRAK